MTDARHRQPPVSLHARGSILAVTIVPRSTRNQLEEAADGALRLRVTASPVDGAANSAVLRFLSESIRVPRSRLEIASGERGRRKRILVSGLSPDELISRLREALCTTK